MATINNPAEANVIYKINSNLLMAQADEIRTLNGTADIMTPIDMTTALQSANAEVAEQEQKIIEITEMLQGKAMGGGGTQTYETCTINLSCTDKYTNIALVNVLCFENGSVVQKTGYVSSTGSNEGLLSQNTRFVSVNNVICGSNVLVIPYSSDITLACRNVVGLSELWVSQLASMLDYSYTRCYEFSVIASAGETASAEFYMYD